MSCLWQLISDYACASGALLVHGGTRAGEKRLQTAMTLPSTQRVCDAGLDPGEHIAIALQPWSSLTEAPCEAVKPVLPNETTNTDREGDGV
jgi:hypothetical protein